MKTLFYNNDLYVVNDEQTLVTVQIGRYVLNMFRGIYLRTQIWEYSTCHNKKHKIVTFLKWSLKILNKF